MKKQLSVAVMAVALITLVAVGGTLAFYTTEATVTNQISTGSVRISLQEPQFAENTDNEYFMADILPGQQIVKDPTITNEGSQPCYVRAKVSLTILKNDSVVTDNIVSLPDGSSRTIKPEDLFTLNDGWTESNGYYYYNSILSSNEQVMLFKTVDGNSSGATVEIPKEWGNEIANATFSLNISAEAIQANHFTPAKDINSNITGWKYSSTGEDVSVPASSSAKPPV